MKTLVHKAEQRGGAQYGWLTTRHSFSFSRWFDPSRMGFGALRVLNDDKVIGGAGFGTHPHDNMEIISIPLRGAMEHADSTGIREVIRTGDIQIMSAGTGVTHSEYNASKSDGLEFLQIWIYPKELGTRPSYGQMSIAEKARKNTLLTVVDPDGDGVSRLRIGQDSRVAIGDLDAGTAVDWSVKSSAHGVYLFVIDGEVEVADTELSARDAIAIEEASSLRIKAISKSATVLLLEVPMKW